MASTSLAVNTSKATRQLAEVLKTKERLENKLAKTAATTEKHIGTVVSAVEIVGTEFGLAYVRGRFGEKDIVGVPWEAWVGLGMHLLGFSGLAGEHAAHLHSVGTASISFAGVVEGLKLGQEHRQAKEKKQKDEQRDEQPKPRRQQQPVNVAGNEHKTNGVPPQRLGPPQGSSLEDMMSQLDQEPEPAKTS